MGDTLGFAVDEGTDDDRRRNAANLAHALSAARECLRKAAESHRTMTERMEEAVRFLAQAEAHGQALGITTGARFSRMRETDRV